MASMLISPETLSDALLSQLLDNLRSIQIILQRHLLSPAQIHAVRVQTKQTRALLRLLTVTQPQSLKSSDLAIRYAAKQLAGSRDLHVMAKTLRQLTTDSEIEQRLLPHLQALLPPQSSCTEAPCRETALAHLYQLTADDLQPKAILRGFKTTRQKALAQAKQARKSDNDASFHKWRKWLKYELYQLEWLAATEALAPHDRKIIRRATKKLAELGNQLGKFQDLCVLEQVLDQLRSSLETNYQNADTENQVNPVYQDASQLLIKLRKRKKSLKKACLKKRQLRTKLPNFKLLSSKSGAISSDMPANTR